MDEEGTKASDTEGETEAPKPRRRRLRWWGWLGIVLLVLAGIATFVYLRAPSYLDAQIRARLSERFGAAVQFDRVEVRWGDLAFDIYDVHYDDGVRLEVDVERVEVGFTYSKLLWGPRKPTVVVHQPMVAFEVRQAPPREEDREPPDLDAFESIEIVGGAAEVSVPTSRGPAFLDLSDLSGRIEPRENATATSKMDLRISAAATVGDAGHLSVEGRTSSRNPAEAWSLRFDLERFELPCLNQLWLDIVEMDVESGYLSLDGDLTRSPEKLQGRIRPHFEEIRLLGANEDALHPMAEALFGHMLMGARSTISIDRPMLGDRGSSLPELLETDWQSILQAAIRNGYARRLSRLDGFEARIGDVQVDFSQGLLQMYDVELDRNDPVLDVPFVQVERIDVVFDPEVATEAPAYKHVTLWEPTATFVTGVEGVETEIKFDDTWIDTISAIPFQTRDLTIHRGRVDLWDFRAEEPISVSVSEIELLAEEMATDLHDPGIRGAQLSATATVLDEAHASIHVVFEPGAVTPNIDIDMMLEPLELTSLAPLLRVFAGVDAVSGHVGLTASIDVYRGRVKASVSPDVHRPKLKPLGRGHMLRRIIIQSALRRLRARGLELRYSMEPGQGVLHEFFPELLKAIFAR
ncbi:MAG: DUF748 domain-containing protein [Myxococcota bacterium]